VDTLLVQHVYELRHASFDRHDPVFVHEYVFP
jgi:hypothetical protein